VKVLLINPPLSTKLPVKGAYPMGLGYIGAMLRRSGCEVQVLDIGLNVYNKIYVSDFLKRNRDRYELVGIGCMVTAYAYVKWISWEIKKYNPHAVLVVGGSICTVDELLLKHSDVDIVCVGEGEKIITDIVKTIRSNKDLAGISNIAFKDGDKVVHTHKESPMEIDSIPFPAWDLFDMDQYTRNNYLVPVKTPSITLIYERGCPFKCSFCYRNFGKKVRYRNIDNIIEEIKTVVNLFGIGHIDFLDEIFNVSTDCVRKLCNKIIDEGIKITWRCIGRTDFCDKETLDLMYEAGCRWIGYGIESGSQKMLDRMNKGQKIENIEKSIRLTRDAGIIVTGTFIIGMPGETEQTIQESRNFFSKNKIFNNPFFPIPYPGADLYNEVIKKGLIVDEDKYISSLEKDATELIINLTELPDAHLLKLRNSLINDFKTYIPSLALKG